MRQKVTVAGQSGGGCSVQVVATPPSRCHIAELGKNESLIQVHENPTTPSEQAPQNATSDARPADDSLTGKVIVGSPNTVAKVVQTPPEALAMMSPEARAIIEKREKGEPEITGSVKEKNASESSLNELAKKLAELPEETRKALLASLSQPSPSNEKAPDTQPDFATMPLDKVQALVSEAINNGECAPGWDRVSEPELREIALQLHNERKAKPLHTSPAA